jgi:cell shape-determining protein MreC
MSGFFDNFQPHRSPKFVGICLLATILLIYKVPTWVQRGVRRDLFALQAPFWRAYARGKDLACYWWTRSHSKEELMETCLNLARENAYLGLKLRENESVRREWKTLCGLCGLRRKEGFGYRLARVVRRHFDTWNQYLYIDLGVRDGLSVGWGVVHGGGVVGRIAEVYENMSVVELLTNLSFKMVVMDEATHTPMSYVGSGGPGLEVPRGTVHNVPLCFQNETCPLPLVTSSLGGVFPDNIPVGTLLSLEAKNDLVCGQVALSPDLMRLREVSVLVPDGAGAS